MKAHLLKGKGTDSGSLTIDKIVYIPDFFAIEHQGTNWAKKVPRQTWLVRINYGEFLETFFRFRFLFQCSNICI